MGCCYSDSNDEAAAKSSGLKAGAITPLLSTEEGCFYTERTNNYLQFQIGNLTISGAEFDEDGADRRFVKVLTLGSGESGKTTILKQIKLCFCGGFSEDERAAAAIAIKTNVIADMKTLLNEIDSNLLAAAGLTAAAEGVAEMGLDAEELTADVAEQLFAQIWADPGVRRAHATIVADRSFVGISASSARFFDRITDIARPEYSPSDDDILRNRVRTTGISSLKLAISELTNSNLRDESVHISNGNVNFKANNDLNDSGRSNVLLVDVGGQRSERAKWKRCFVGVDIVVFVASLSEFDEMCFEDRECSRTEDTLDLFEAIARSDAFAGTPFVLVLNKRDIFVEKLRAPEKREAFRHVFKELGDVEGSIEDCVRAVAAEFGQRGGARNPGAEIETVISCAMERESVADVCARIGKKALEIQRSGKR